MPLSADVVRPDALTPADLAHWRALCADEPFRSPLLSPEFALAVGAARPDAWVAVLKLDGSRVGFLAHHRGVHGHARPIGAPFSDYHAVITDPVQPIDLPAALTAAGLRSFRHTGLIDPRGRDGTVVEGYGIDLTGLSAGDYLEELRRRDAKRFKNWRRLSHKLVREQVDISFGPDASPESLRRVIGWKRAQLRRSGLHDVLRPAWAQAMMRGLLARQASDFGGLLLTLRVAGRPIAGHFGTRSGEVFHPWVAAFDPEFAPYSPGVLFLLRTIEAMPDLGLRLYDLSAGSDHYKRPFANANTRAWAGLTRATGAPSRRPDRLQTSKPALVGRIGKRLEHIAAAETSLAGRVRGLIDAVRDAPKRLGDAAPDLS